MKGEVQVKKLLIFVVGFACAIALVKHEEIVSWVQERCALADRTDYMESDGGVVTSTPLTPERELELAQAWENGTKRICLDRLRILRKSLFERSACPAYKYNDRYRQAAESALSQLESAIGRDDYIVAPRARSEAEDAMRRFETSCYWKSGVSKGSGTNMHSGSREGTWEPDRGYVMMRSNSGELVARREISCGHCGGRGSVVEVVCCSSCNGQGQVNNPAYQVGSAMETTIGIMNAFGGARGRRPIRPVRNNQPPTIPCRSCNGRGSLNQTRTCTSCGGAGKQYQ